MASEKFHIKVYAVVSDNASPMVSMGKKIDIWHTTCHSHSGNLLAKDLVPKEFAQKLNRLLREFKSAGAENQLKKRGGSRIILACDTRWCSYRDAFRCLLKNLHLMRELVKEQIVKRYDEKKKLIDDSSFESELQDCILIFDPVCELINVCEKSKSCIADACEEWLKLEVPADNDVHQEKLSKRLEKVLSPMVLAANVLHPQYRGRHFKNSDQLMEAIEFLEIQLTSQNSINDDSLNALMKLNEEIEIYPLNTVDAVNLRDFELLMNRSLIADGIGSKSRAIGFYKQVVQLLTEFVSVRKNLAGMNKMKIPKEKIESRIDSLRVIIDDSGLNDYLNNLKIFEKLQTFNLPGAFWTAAGPFYPKLVELAQKLLRIPAVSAQLERLFSSWAYIHSDLRNRLTVDRSMKLVDIYYSLKMNELYDEYYDDYIED